MAVKKAKKKAASKRASSKKARGKKTTKKKASGRKAKSASTQYTNPELRERVKRKVMKSSKGGKPGQWSARKAQLVASEYKKAGGGYKGGKKSSQKHLDKWTDEKWTTSDGKKAIRGKGKKSETVRYLPESAWKKLSAAEKRATNTKKRGASKRGRQFVKNTKAAAKAGRRARAS